MIGISSSKGRRVEDNYIFLDLPSTVPLPPIPSGIPAELKSLPQWVAWRSVPDARRKKPSKIPVCPATGRNADHSDPTTWGSFDSAYSRYFDDRLAGVGFVFQSSGGLTGVDLDHCRHPDSGELDPWASAIQDELSTYAEVSPSATGIKLIAKGQLDPNGRRRKGQVEMYDRSRFFALTGHRLQESPEYVAPRQDSLARLQQSLLPQTKTTTPVTTRCGGVNGSDPELLDVAFRATNGSRVQSLWDGGLGRHPSYSEALLGLARRLAFYSGPDADRLERLVLNSPLWLASEYVRKKWYSARKGSTWGRVYVIGKAIDSCPFFYNPKSQTAKTISQTSVGHNSYTGVWGLILTYTASTTSPPEESEPVTEQQQQECTAVTRAWARVAAGEIPDGLPSDVLDDDVSTRLAALCWHLAGRRRGGRFYLDVRTAAAQLSKSKNTANRRFQLLERLGVIRLIEKGRRANPGETAGQASAGQASVYEWIADSYSGYSGLSELREARKAAA